MSPSERMQANARKTDILSSALAVFAMKGFAATTTKDLAKAAKVSEGLLYKHFPSKESLYQELGRYISSESTGVSGEVARIVPSTQSLVLGIYYLTRMVLSGPCGGEKEHDYLLRMMCRSLLEDGLFAKAFMEGAFLPYVQPLEAFFEAARKAGDLHTTTKTSDRFGLFFCHHLMVGVRLHGLRKGAPLEIDADVLLRESVMFNLRGIGLKEAAIRKHCDFKKLDRWYAEVFDLGPVGGDPRQAQADAGPARRKRK